MMYKPLIIWIFVLGIFADAYATQHQFQPGTGLIDGENIAAGDTVCLLGGNWDGILLKNIHGTATEPVVVMNNNGVVVIDSKLFYGIKFSRCSFIKLSGSGQPQFKYGIQILSIEQATGTGISIDNKSTDIEVEFIEIANIPIGGIYAKTEPDYFTDCSFTAVRDSFTMYNTSIHDCYLHDIGNEGMYIGSSKYTGQTIYHCNDTVVLPHLLEGVKIYNNTLEDIGWDGIQVSSAISDCEIFNNTIIRNSTAGEEFQMSGILIGGGSKCDCYNNRIIGGKGGGIEYLGLGNSRIFNNLILHPGENYHTGESPYNWQKHGIWIGEVVTDDNALLFIQNNTIIGPRTFGIKMVNNVISEYLVQNNLIAEPGAYPLSGDEAFISSISSSNVHQENNLFAADVEQAGFINVQENNYDLLASSPAVNNGSSLSFDFDIDYRTRPYNGKFDIGAYECQDSSLFVVNELKGEELVHGIKPNPFSEEALIYFRLTSREDVVIKLFNASGICIYQKSVNAVNAGYNEVELPVRDLQNGWFLYEITTSGNIYRGKAVKR